VIDVSETVIVASGTPREGVTGESDSLFFLKTIQPVDGLGRRAFISVTMREASCAIKEASGMWGGGSQRLAL
jgi:hypothetical protein